MKPFWDVQECNEEPIDQNDQNDNEKEDVEVPDGLLDDQVDQLAVQFLFKAVEVCFEVACEEVQVGAGDVGCYGENNQDEW